MSKRSSSCGKKDFLGFVRAFDKLTRNKDNNDHNKKSTRSAQNVNNVDDDFNLKEVTTTLTSNNTEIRTLGSGNVKNLNVAKPDVVLNRNVASSNIGNVGSMLRRTRSSLEESNKTPLKIVESNRQQKSFSSLRNKKNTKLQQRQQFSLELNTNYEGLYNDSINIKSNNNNNKIANSNSNTNNNNNDIDDVIRRVTASTSFTNCAQVIKQLTVQQVEEISSMISVQYLLDNIPESLVLIETLYSKNNRNHNISNNNVNIYSFHDSPIITATNNNNNNKNNNFNKNDIIGSNNFNKNSRNVGKGITNYLPPDVLLNHIISWMCVVDDDNNCNNSNSNNNSCIGGSTSYKNGHNNENFISDNGSPFTSKSMSFKAGKVQKQLEQQNSQFNSYKFIVLDILKHIFAASPALRNKTTRKLISLEKCYDIASGYKVKCDFCEESRLGSRLESCISESLKMRIEKLKMEFVNLMRDANEIDRNMCCCSSPTFACDNNNNSNNNENITINNNFSINNNNNSANNFTKNKGNIGDGFKNPSLRSNNKNLKVYLTLKGNNCNNQNNSSVGDSNSSNNHNNDSTKTKINPITTAPTNKILTVSDIEYRIHKHRQLLEMFEPIERCVVQHVSSLRQRLEDDKEILQNSVEVSKDIESCNVNSLPSPSLSSPTSYPLSSPLSPTSLSPSTSMHPLSSVALSTPTTSSSLSPTTSSSRLPADTPILKHLKNLVQGYSRVMTLMKDDQLGPRVFFRPNFSDVDQTEEMVVEKKKKSRLSSNSFNVFRNFGFGIKSNDNSINNSINNNNVSNSNSVNNNKFFTLPRRSKSSDYNNNKSNNKRDKTKLNHSIEIINNRNKINHDITKPISNLKYSVEYLFSCYDKLFRDGRISVLRAFNEIDQLQKNEQQKNKIILSVVLLSGKAARKILRHIQLKTQVLLGLTIHNNPTTVKNTNNRINNNNSNNECSNNNFDGTELDLKSRECIKELNDTIKSFLRISSTEKYISNVVEELKNNFLPNLVSTYNLTTCQPFLNFLKDASRISWFLTIHTSTLVPFCEGHVFDSDIHERVGPSDTESVFVRSFVWPGLKEENSYMKAVKKALILT